MLIRLSVAVLMLALYDHELAVSAQTLYTVSAAWSIFNPWANATISVSAIGKDNGGATTFVEVATAVPSVYVTDKDLRGSSLVKPQTVHVEPFTETFVEDASGWRASAHGFGDEDVEVTCSFGPSGRGACVESLAHGSFTTDIVTFSGSVVPFYTLAVGTPAPTSVGASVTASTPGSPTSTSPPNAAVQNAELSRFAPTLTLIVAVLVHFT